MISRDATSAPSEYGSNVVTFPSSASASVSATALAALSELAFNPEPNLLTVLMRVIVLQSANAERPIRAKDVMGDDPARGLHLRNVQGALAELLRRGQLTQSPKAGYRTAFDPSTYVQRAPQAAAHCGDQAPTPEIDPETLPADPLTAVKAYEAATRTGLRHAKWKENALHDFYYANRDVTSGEMRQAMSWIIANWRAVLKGHQFTALWNDQWDDDGFIVRRASAPPASPEPEFLGKHANKFWKAWSAELARAERQRRSDEEAVAQAARYAEELKCANELGMTIPAWRQHVADLQAQESRRKLEEQRAKNPVLLRLMAETAARREREAAMAASSPPPPRERAV